MSQTLHIGVFTLDPDPSRLPSGVIADGDSFLEWGETHPGDYAVPYHLTAERDEWTAADVKDAREQFTRFILRSGERLTDYSVVTDTEDWSVDVAVVTLEGAVTYDRASQVAGTERLRAEIRQESDPSRLDKILDRIEEVLDRF